MRNARNEKCQAFLVGVSLTEVSKLIKVVSGGQTGVDQGALRAARDSGLDIGGWCPPGAVCEAGKIPEDFLLTETPEQGSRLAPGIARSLRTEWNVRDSDATLILKPKGPTFEDPGTECTAVFALHYLRPFRSWDPADLGVESLVGWIRGLDLKILNVGGPSESTVPGIEARSYNFLLRVFEQLAKPAQGK